jgi:hypothetical protein
MQETNRARGTGRMKLMFKSVMALALFTLFMCGGFGYKDNKCNESNKNKNKTLNSKIFK